MKKILVTSGIHGEERSGPIALMRMVELLERQPNHFANLDLDIIPVLSPTAYCLRTRENYDGDNFNHFWTDEIDEDEPYTVSHIRGFLRHRKYDALYSFHEDEDTDEFYLYATNIDRNSKLIQNIFEFADAHQFKRHEGYDDLIDDHIVEGYGEVDPNNPLETFEEWMSRARKADRILTVEIGGKNYPERKIMAAWDILYTILLWENQSETFKNQNT